MAIVRRRPSRTSSWLCAPFAVVTCFVILSLGWMLYYPTSPPRSSRRKDGVSSLVVGQAQVVGRNPQGVTKPSSSYPHDTRHHKGGKERGKEVISSPAAAAGDDRPAVGAASLSSQEEGKEDTMMCVLSLATTYGVVDVELLPQVAPKAVASIVHHFRSSPTDGNDEGRHHHHTASSSFYRNEAIPNGSRGEPAEGPPYALLQGRLPGAFSHHHHVEPSTTIRWGDVVHITQSGAGGDFFIALANHDSWAHSFTVFGRVITAHDGGSIRGGGGSNDQQQQHHHQRGKWEEEEGMAVVLNLTSRPYRQQRHPTGTMLRMMVDPVPINPSVRGNGCD